MAERKHWTKSEMEQFVRGELPPEEQSEAEAHFETCRLCERALANVRKECEDDEEGRELMGHIVQEREMLCYSREELAAYAAGRTPEEQAARIRVHVNEIQCDRCEAVLAELRAEEPFTDDELHKMRDQILRQTTGPREDRKPTRS